MPLQSIQNAAKSITISGLPHLPLASSFKKKFAFLVLRCWELVRAPGWRTGGSTSRNPRPVGFSPLAGKPGLARSRKQPLSTALETTLSSAIITVTNRWKLHISLNCESSFLKWLVCNQPKAPCVYLTPGFFFFCVTVCIVRAEGSVCQEASVLHHPVHLVAPRVGAALQTSHNDFHQYQRCAF